MNIECPKCQTDNPEDSKFCKECGTPFLEPKEVIHTKTLETPTEELTTGSTFAGRYQIIEELGKGGMGRVYKANDTKIKEKIALKLIKPEIAKDKKTIERFSNELKLARKIRHKNVCAMFDLGEEKGVHFFTMEYISGQDLKGLIRQTGQLTVGKAISIAKQICEGLAEAHSLGVVHRDLKPNNIMVDQGGNARIMDFGIARSLSIKGITGAGVVIGTPEYMSPEQVEGKETDQRSDIYSLGVVLYEMVTGRVPFEGDTPFSVGMKHKSEMPKDPRELNDQIQEEISQMILRCMEKDKESRYQSAEELHSELVKIEKGIPITEKVVPKRKSPTSKEITITFGKRWMIIAALFVAAIVVGISILYFITKRLGPTPERNMLVVLPFENLGPPEDEYFADGITGEIIARLTSASRLGVIARTSAIQYKNTKKTIQEIGEELGVDYILEGTVRWQRVSEGQSRVRVTPLLIRVSDSTHVWAKVYDEVMDEIFQVQSDIASQVVEALDITLLEPERRVLEANPTDNIEAYQAYLRGMDYRRRVDFSEEIYRMEVRMFERAVEIDPGFALAYAVLSMAHSDFYHEGYDRTEERLALAKAAADQAFKLQSDLPEAHRALGIYYYYGMLDYSNALEQFTIAQEKQPKNSEILMSIGAVLRRQGRFENALDNFKRAFLLNPRDAEIPGEIGVTCMVTRRYEEAEQYFELSRSLAPDQTSPYLSKAYNRWLWDGATEKARAELEEIPKKNGPKLIFFWFRQELYERNYSAALDILSSASVDSFPGSEWEYISKDQLVGQVYKLMNEPELSRTSYESARMFLERNIKERPDDPRVHSSLGIVYAALDFKAEAIREGKLGVELYPVSKDALVGTARVMELAHIYMMVGEYDAALDQLEYLLSIPSHVSVPMLRIDPQWDQLRENPRFQQLLEKYSE